MYAAILHIEYLLRRHDCVILPGFGAFIAHRNPAHFIESKEVTMLPPHRDLSFNPELRDNDGLLARSICRRERVDYHQALDLIRGAVGEITARLEREGEFNFGRLGRFDMHDGFLTFEPQPDAVNRDYRDLKPIHPALLETATNRQATVLRSVPERTAEEPEAEEPARRSFLRNKGIAIAASLALLVTITLFILNPIRLNNEPAKASLAPAPAQTEHPAPAAEPVPAPVADSTVRDYDNIRLRTDDPWCVVVYSSLTREEAENYIDSNPDRPMAIAKPGKWYLIYAATGSTQEEAYAQSRALGDIPSWISPK